ncbi:ATPase of 26S proteasome regulatory subunit 4, variant 2 [Dionaea muscipula]
MSKGFFFFPLLIKYCLLRAFFFDRVLSQDIPTDIVVDVGEASFSLHKFMLVAKSNYMRKLILESKETDLARINLSDIPGGPEIFEKAAKFCYGVNFEITVHNVAALRCAAEYLQMTNKYSENNLASRTEDFLNQVALTTLPTSVIVLKACEELLPMAHDLKIVQKCVEVICSKACSEASFPSRTPTNWWTEELSVLNVVSFEKIIVAMKSRGAKAQTVASAIITYAERSLRYLVRDQTGNGINSSDSEIRSQQKTLLELIVSLLPSDKAAFPVSFLCSLLRSAIILKASSSCMNELEKRISSNVEHVSVDDLLVLSCSYDGQSLFDLESVRRIITGFVTKEKSVDVFNGGNHKEVYSTSMQRVVKTVDGYLGEIATYSELSISKFNGIANLVPKGARRVDDDLYRATDIYLKVHPDLDEIEREKVCSSLDPLKLSYEARVHASQNKRLPVQIVLHALYFDRLKLRSGVDDGTGVDAAATMRNQLKGDVSLLKENEALRSELMKMKMHISDLQRKGTSSNDSNNQGTFPTKVVASQKKHTFFSSMSKTLGKLNPFKHGSKDTLNIHDAVDVAKPKRRRFSMS